MLHVLLLLILVDIIVDVLKNAVFVPVTPTNFNISVIRLGIAWYGVFACLKVKFVILPVCPNFSSPQMTGFPHKFFT